MGIFTRSNRAGRPTFLRFLIPCLALFASSMLAYGQVTVTLSKSCNAPNPVPSGQAFTYTLAYSWSGGAPGTLTITDTLDPQLVPGSTLPAATVSGNIITFNLTGLSASAGAGTVQINSMFAPGTTCNGAQACNKAWISFQGSSTAAIASNSVCVTASATNKWTFQKALVAGCALNDDVIFRVCVMNPTGGDIGGYNLVSPTLTDIVPANAVVTSVSGNWTTFVQTGSNVTLGGGPSTLYVSPWNVWYCVYIHVTFPSANFTTGQTVTNSANFSARTPCDPKAVTYTSSAPVTLCAANPAGNLWKGLSINLYFPSNPYYYPAWSPGCCGTYTLYYSNSGNVAQPGFVMEDLPPTTIDINSITTNVPAGQTVTMSVYCWSGTSCGTVPCTTVTYASAGAQVLSTPPANICKIRWAYSNPIVVTQSLTNYLDVCVRNASYASPFTPVAPPQNIVNTMTAQATNLSLISTNLTKAVDSLKPKILATKLFMGGCTGCTANTAGPWVPGNIVRWRMAVANVGSAAASPCTITDALPAGLTYVGNPTYYYGNFNWMANQYNPPCCSLSVSVPSQIGGTITTPTVGQTNLTWTFPTLPSRCDGTVDYFIIEFDVKIGDAPPMPPGQYNNTFTFAAGNLTTPVVSNPATLTVNAIAQLILLKGVRKTTPTDTFALSATAPAGGAIEYKLRLKNTGNLALSGICLLDIMPHISDIAVLPGYTARGSQFDIPVTSGTAITAPAGYTKGYNTSANTKNPRRTTVCGGFCGITDPVTGFGTITNGIFGVYSSPTFSFNVSGGSTQLLPGGTLDVLVAANVPAGTAVGKVACNNFAVQATPVGTTTCLSTQSTNACVTVQGPQVDSHCLELWKDGSADSCCGYHLTIPNSVGGLQSLGYQVISPGGVVNSINTSPCAPTSTVPANLANTTSGQLIFNTACTSTQPTTIAIDASSTTSDGLICIRLTAVVQTSQGTTVDCIDTICFHCKPQTKTRCDSLSVKPFPFPNLDLSGRTFTIYNLKVPASPICSVKVTVVPPPSGPGVNGGGLYVDGVWKSWPYGTSSAYTQITSVHGLPANNTVAFNLGIDYTIGWVGVVNITVYHCDGDSCTERYGPWKADKGNIISVGTPIDIPEKAKLHVYRIAFPPGKVAGQNVRGIAIRHHDPVESIVAVTGGSYPCDSAANCNDQFDALRVRDRTVFVELRHALDSTDKNASDPSVTVLYTSSNERTPVVDIVYYNGDGQEIGKDTATVKGSTLLDVDNPNGVVGIQGTLLAKPNPTDGHCDATFTLQTQSTVELQLLDLIGNKVLDLVTNKRMEAGTYTRQIDMTSLPSGSYLLTLRVNGIPSVVRVELTR